MRIRQHASTDVCGHIMTCATQRGSPQKTGLRRVPILRVAQHIVATTVELAVLLAGLHPHYQHQVFIGQKGLHTSHHVGALVGIEQGTGQYICCKGSTAPRLLWQCWVIRVMFTAIILSTSEQFPQRVYISCQYQCNSLMVMGFFMLSDATIVGVLFG